MAASGRCYDWGRVQSRRSTARTRCSQAAPLGGQYRTRTRHTPLHEQSGLGALRDPLRIAQVFEDTLSREVLHTLLAEIVGNRRHRPGPNHRALLRLPWTDVLKRNYDTPLERAVPSSGRRYVSDYAPEDLSAARLHRIIKLHGSLPDHRPLIITEEDYRTLTESAYS